MEHRVPPADGDRIETCLASGVSNRPGPWARRGRRARSHRAAVRRGRRGGPAAVSGAGRAQRAEARPRLRPARHGAGRHAARPSRPPGTAPAARGTPGLPASPPSGAHARRSAVHPAVSRRSVWRHGSTEVRWLMSAFRRSVSSSQAYRRSTQFVFSISWLVSERMAPRQVMVCVAQGRLAEVCAAQPGGDRCWTGRPPGG